MRVSNVQFHLACQNAKVSLCISFNRGIKSGENDFSAARSKKRNANCSNTATTSKILVHLRTLLRRKIYAKFNPPLSKRLLSYEIALYLGTKCLLLILVSVKCTVNGNSGILKAMLN